MTENAIPDALTPVYETRRENLKALAAEAGGAAKLARRLSISTAYMSQLIGESALKRTVSEKMARKTERELALMFGWLDMKRAA